MGRRKIEIQPITHERNRSVTFIKRKNGLFKKAYELGVLCSVEIAVIIFEERPGHQVKLYQYGSSDVRSILQRHLHYDGEKDTKTPNDFSGSGAAKMDDVADPDADDDGDDDEFNNPSPTTPAVSKRENLKTDFAESSASSAMSVSDLTMPVDMDYQHPRPVVIPHPPIPIHHTVSSLPISGERLSSHTNPNKKLRLMSDTDVKISNTSRASSDDIYGYPTSPPGPSTSSAPLRPQQHLQNIPYTLFTSFQPTPQTYLMGNVFDYPHPLSPSSTRHGQRNTPFPSHQPHSAPVYHDHGQQQQGIYHPSLRPHPRHPSSQPLHQPSRHDAITPDIYPPIVEAEEQMRQQGHGPHRGFGTINWPEHARPVSAHREQDPGVATAAEETTWLDFLSGTASAPSSVNPQAVAARAPAAESSTSVSTTDPASWELDRHDTAFSTSAPFVNMPSPSVLGNSSMSTPPLETSASVDGGSSSNSAAEVRLLDSDNDLSESAEMNGSSTRIRTARRRGQTLNTIFKTEEVQDNTGMHDDLKPEN